MIGIILPGLEVYVKYILQLHRKEMFDGVPVAAVRKGWTANRWVFFIVYSFLWFLL